ncbi:hypothetical protein QJS10_CPA05g01435 [Acorus calamus]|uniref:Uncharacterized protein n=1 Tax=Acorus calamus TaxID=4465 RepID=A0AAV9ESM0_ACOCL|nr:hypothetical protein QJS10_CPA05g01435 [Acorus calamus]
MRNTFHLSGSFIYLHHTVTLYTQITLRGQCFTYISLDGSLNHSFHFCSCSFWETITTTTTTSPTTSTTTTTALIPI